MIVLLVPVVVSQLISLDLQLNNILHSLLLPLHNKPSIQPPHLLDFNNNNNELLPQCQAVPNQLSDEQGSQDIPPLHHKVSILNSSIFLLPNTHTHTHTHMHRHTQTHYVNITCILSCTNLLLVKCINYY